MSKDNKRGLTPHLRFREFSGNYWDTDELGQVAELIDERTGDKEYTTLSVTSGLGLVSQKEKFGREISGSSYKNYYVVRKLDFAYNKSATKLYPEGYISMLENLDEGAVPNSIFTCFRVNRNKIHPPFLNYLFHDNFHGKWLRKFIEVGARAHGSLSIDTDVLFKLPIVYPSIKEQEKIADCLFSLDELITAENQKLEALQLHKKGLMQQLFPAEGEMVPKLRFKEFKDSGEWDIKPLGEVAENLDSKRIPITENERESGNVPYYGASGIIDYVKDFIFDEELLCISEDGANLVARNYPIAFSISGKTWVNNHAHVLRFANRFTQIIVENYLNESNLEDYLTGMAQPKLNRSKLDIIPIPLPSPDEQITIANFLTSLVDLIKQQSHRIENLNAHKKGLMQQLFPDVNASE